MEVAHLEVCLHLAFGPLPSLYVENGRKQGVDLAESRLVSDEAMA